ncbi:hypothetical protein HanIR_Chr05g0210281 [Helianthus annuus]|nr:hypothetical protein HanIR_Chr05g0210281 [Helianthus annuus]
MLTTLWEIWKARNERIFNNIRSHPDKAVEIIKAMIGACSIYSVYEICIFFGILLVINVIPQCIIVTKV